MGGLGRVLRGAAAVRRSRLVHARSDLAAASALIGRVDTWVWDVRSLWADQRIALGMLTAGSPEERIIRLVEAKAAERSAAIVTLTDSAIDVLEARHGIGVREKSTVVPTCVDLTVFEMAPLSPFPPIRFLLSGSLNRFYDVPTMLRFVRLADESLGAKLTVLSADQTDWERDFERVHATRTRAEPREVPSFVAASHVGLSVCRQDAGISLRAAVPTKIAEFLACGRPVVVNAGLGDLDALLPRYDAGVVLSGTTEAELNRGVSDLVQLLQDSSTPERCHRLAVDHFDLDRGVERLIETYRRVT